MVNVLFLGLMGCIPLTVQLGSPNSGTGEPDVDQSLDTGDSVDTDTEDTAIQDTQDTDFEDIDEDGVVASEDCDDNDPLVSSSCVSQVGLYAEYLLDEGMGQVLNDNSGNGYSGFIGENTGADDYDAGWSSGFFSTNTSGCATIENVNFTQSGPYTIHVAVRADSDQTHSTPRMISFRGTDSSGSNVSLQYSTYGSQFTIDRHANYSNQTSLDPLDGDWHLISYVENDEDYFVYVDGVLDFSSTINTPFTWGAVQEVVFGGARCGVDHFVGDFAYLSLYDVAQSPREIFESNASIRDTLMIQGVTLPEDVDADGDGYYSFEDCDDTDPNSTTVSIDADCDSVPTNDDCNDNDVNSTTVADDVDCDGTMTVEDCDDTDPISTIVADDVDCDGTITADDCDDNDATVAELCCNYSNCDENLDLGGGQSMDLVLIPSGADPQGRYTITSDFYLMNTEVTQGMFTALMSYDPTTYSFTYGVGDNHPVYYMNWHMSADFANKVTQRHNSVNGTSFPECYTCSNSGTTSVTCTQMNPYQCSGYVLPTDAEWEYAARSGTQYDFWTPDGGGNYSVQACNGTETILDGVNDPPLRNYAWYCGNSNNQYGADGSKPVGQKLPNDFGLYDMHGNVYEWTADWHTCNYPQSSTDPYCGTQGAYRIVRGAGWGYQPNKIGASSRVGGDPLDRNVYFGFRLGRHP
jgi:formylglycine-generating enzyme required for sulfatase activity